MIYEQPVCYELEQIKAPTLIIVGGDDRTVIEKSKVPKELLPTAGLFTQMAEHAAHLIPHGSYTVVPHTGHIAHIESTEEFHSRLFKFLSELK
jgi:pimeloyl-ACP methyl ester carboxylesterase